MKLLTNLPVIILSGLCLNSCSNQNTTVAESPENIKAEIEKILQTQENIYGSHNEEELKKFAATCEDSLVFIGGDDGGMMVSSNAYVHDLADGYTQRPHDRSYRIYNNTVIVTSVHQGYKLFGKDTLYLNARSSKVFVKDGKDWKMAYVTYAPLPVIYKKPGYTNPENFAGYEGYYTVGPGITDTVTVSGGKVFSSITGSEKAELIPLDDSTFIGEGYFGKAVFSRNAEGKVTHYYFEWTDGQQINFMKTK